MGRIVGPNAVIDPAFSYFRLLVFLRAPIKNSTKPGKSRFTAILDAHRLAKGGYVFEVLRTTAREIGE